MRILLTGDRGRLGVPLRRHLEHEGHDVAGFDLRRGDDILDAGAVECAADGVDAIVHLAGMADDLSTGAADVMQVNLVGVWNVLLAARANSVERVINMSSGKAIGMLQRDPAYLPLDDDHPEKTTSSLKGKTFLVVIITELGN